MKNFTKMLASAGLVLGFLFAAPAYSATLPIGDGTDFSTATLMTTPNTYELELDPIGALSGTPLSVFGTVEVGADRRIGYDIALVNPTDGGSGRRVGELSVSIERFASDETALGSIFSGVLTDTDGNALGAAATPGFFPILFNSLWDEGDFITIAISGIVLDGGNASVALTSSAVPIPAPLLLFAAAMLGLGVVGRRRSKVMVG